MKNKTQKYDTVFWLGRAEPPHHGHVSTIIKAFEYGDKVVVAFGTHDAPRTIKNPWTTEERIQMVLASIPLEFHSRIAFFGAEDYQYSDAEWLTNVTAKLRSTASHITQKENPSIAMIAHAKDDTSYYINYFKFLKEIISVDEVKVGGEDDPALSSTKIRELYFEGYLDFIANAVPDGVYQFLRQFRRTAEFTALKAEYDDAVAYQKMFENVPFKNSNFLTSDSVVFQSGHVLLIQRGDSPGKGLWALPGGHLNNNETFLEGAIRELREETELKVPEKVLRGSIFAEKVFDHPDRSLRCRIKGNRGRSVTMAFGYKLDDSATLPHVKGSDDAAQARWIPIDVVLNEMRSQLFEDHWHLIKYMADRIPQAR